MDKPRLLLVDDNAGFLDLFQIQPECADFNITAVPSAEAAVHHLGRSAVDLVITDVQMPGMDGIELFGLIQDLYPDVPVILMTAFGSTEQAVDAVKQGAFHYFEKPLTDKLELFWSTVREGVAKGELTREITRLRADTIRHRDTESPIIGRSESIQRVLASVAEVAELPATVLVTGETGTGKGQVARAIHARSPRRDHSLVSVNCHALAPGVLESELFGHERGAFTGAVERKRGFFEMAHRGTLFLDEISETPLPIQTKLLTVLEEKRFSRVGGTATIHSDFRLIAATNRDLSAAVAAETFRQDLFYRLHVYVIDIPPLRHRREDIPAIAEYYAQKFSTAYGRRVTRFSERALTALREYDWPGNVRELVNVMERAVITCRDDLITTAHLPFAHPETMSPSDLNLKQMENFYIDLALRRTGGNKTKAAELLGIARKTLIEKIKKIDSIC